MKYFRSKCSTGPAQRKIKKAKVKKVKRGRCLEQHEIKGFSRAVRSDPVLIHCFINVPIGIVHHLVNKMLDLLRTPWKEGLEGMIMPFFELEVLDYIREQEVDPLFTHFISEYQGPADNLAVDYWQCLSLDKREVAQSKPGNNKTNVRALHTEVTQNQLLSSRFWSLLLTSFAKLMKKIVKALVSKKVATEFSEEVEKLKKMEFTDLEFEEFAKLYFKICSSDSDYLANAWANVVEIKNAIVSPSNKKSNISNHILLESNDYEELPSYKIN
jgi:hypothetical protein